MADSSTVSAAIDIESLLESEFFKEVVKCNYSDITNPEGEGDVVSSIARGSDLTEKEYTRVEVLSEFIRPLALLSASVHSVGKTATLSEMTKNQMVSLAEAIKSEADAGGASLFGTAMKHVLDIMRQENPEKESIFSCDHRQWRDLVISLGGAQSELHKEIRQIGERAKRAQQMQSSLNEKGDEMKGLTGGAIDPGETMEEENPGTLAQKMEDLDLEEGGPDKDETNGYPPRAGKKDDGKYGAGVHEAEGVQKDYEMLEEDYEMIDAPAVVRVKTPKVDLDGWFDNEELWLESKL